MIRIHHWKNIQDSAPSLENIQDLNPSIQKLEGSNPDPTSCLNFNLNFKQIFFAFIVKVKLWESQKRFSLESEFTYNNNTIRHNIRIRLYLYKSDNYCSTVSDICLNNNISVQQKWCKEKDIFWFFVGFPSPFCLLTWETCIQGGLGNNNNMRYIYCI